MSKRIRLTSERVNSYGTRVLTAGIDMTQYARNPVLLYMHRRGEVIGMVKDVRVENNEMTAELVFDEASELSKRCKKQYEFGSLRMVSVGLDIIELSNDPADLVEGQKHHTVKRSRLNEVSLVDIGSNDDAVVLSHEGKLLTLSTDGSCDLP